MSLDFIKNKPLVDEGRTRIADEVFTVRRGGLIQSLQFVLPRLILLGQEVVKYVVRRGQQTIEEFLHQLHPGGFLAGSAWFLERPMTETRRIGVLSSTLEHR